MTHNYTVFVCRKISTKARIFILLCIGAFVLYGCNFFIVKNPNQLVFSDYDKTVVALRAHIINVEKFYKYRVTWETSKLGGVLFKREEFPYPNRNANRTFNILVWKHWNWLKNRHVYYFGSRRNASNILEDCSVQNCNFSGDDNLIDTADAVVIHLQKGLIPQVDKRNPKQRWIFLNDESPKNSFTLSEKPFDWKSLSNVFNWSMTYRSDSDVPVPYGRTIPLDEPINESMEMDEIALLVPHWKEKRRDVPATVLMSDCSVKKRNNILTILREFIKVDVYGTCSDKEENKKSCPGHYAADCDPISKYLFYLVLENSNCYQYLTEKVFYNAYAKGAIPIIWGASLDDIVMLLPLNSYLYVDQLTDMEVLAKDIESLMSSDDLLLSMHMWRNNYAVVNEHGYFGSKSYHLCRLCEAMNYNDEGEKIYGEKDVKKFFDPSRVCRS